MFQKFWGPWAPFWNFSNFHKHHKMQYFDWHWVHRTLKVTIKTCFTNFGGPGPFYEKFPIFTNNTKFNILTQNGYLGPWKSPIKHFSTIWGALDPFSKFLKCHRHHKIQYFDSNWVCTTLKVINRASSSRKASKSRKVGIFNRKK